MKKMTASEFRELVIVLCMGVLVLTNAGLAVVGVTISGYYRSVSESQVAQRDTGMRTAVATEMIADAQGSPMLELATPIISSGYPTVVSVPRRRNETDREWVRRYIGTIEIASAQ